MDFTKLPQLAAFAQIALHGSFTKAAAEMGITRAAASQSLLSLERKLKVKLLHRTTRDMSLTEAGQRLYDQLRPALREIESAVNCLHMTKEIPSGVLKINTSRSAAKHFIEPHVDEFLRLYPQLKLELVMDDGLANIIADGCDAGVRLGESLGPNVVAVPITGTFEMAVVGAPGYLARHGVPRSPEELSAHNCLAYRHSTSGLICAWEFQDPGRDGQPVLVEPKGRLTTNDDECLIRAALKGDGLIQHIDYAVGEHLAAGTLVRMLGAWCKPFPGFYFYVPSREYLPVKVRAFRDFLAEVRTRQLNGSSRRPDEG